MSPEALHADLIALLPDTAAGRRTEMFDRAADLAAVEGVQSIVVVKGEGDGDFDLGFLFVLEDVALLESFGTDQRYTRFLQGGVAPVLRGLAGADIRLLDSFPEIRAYAACLAIIAPPTTYDWEVRSHLQGWQEDLKPAASTAGLALGEHGRYRGVAVAFSDEPLQATKPEISKLAIDLLVGKARKLA